MIVSDIRRGHSSKSVVRKHRLIKENKNPYIVYMWRCVVDQIINPAIDRGRLSFRQRFQTNSASDLAARAFLSTACTRVRRKYFIPNPETRPDCKRRGVPRRSPTDHRERTRSTHSVVENVQYSAVNIYCVL